MKHEKRFTPVRLCICIAEGLALTELGQHVLRITKKSGQENGVSHSGCVCVEECVSSQAMMFKTLLNISG
jgi:hypothetical protein